MTDMAATRERGHDGHPDCPKCWGNGVVADPFGPPPTTVPCPVCGGSGAGPYDHTITADVRLGAVLAGLTLASRVIRDTVKQASAPTAMRQSLDGDEHEGHWLTRKQVYDAVQAAAELERIWREVSLRVDRISTSHNDEKPDV